MLAIYTLTDLASKQPQFLITNFEQIYYYYYFVVGNLYPTFFDSDLLRHLL